jgi:hypothetical protein
MSQLYTDFISQAVDYLPLVSKCSVSRGAVAGSNTQEATDRVTVLKDEIKVLDDYEKLLDQHKSVCCILVSCFVRNDCTFRSIVFWRCLGLKLLTK